MLRNRLYSDQDREHPCTDRYSITVSNDGNGRATASLAKGSCAGTAITLTATPNAGYHFKAWQAASTRRRDQHRQQIHNACNDNVEIKAIFEKNASSGGYVPTVQKPEITIIGSGKADLSADGRTATITAAADTNWYP